MTESEYQRLVALTTLRHAKNILNESRAYLDNRYHNDRVASISQLIRQVMYDLEAKMEVAPDEPRTWQPYEGHGDGSSIPVTWRLESDSGPAIWTGAAWEKVQTAEEAHDGE